MKPWKKAKITVLKKIVFKDLADEYVDDDSKSKGFGECDAVQTGQEFILERPRLPEGFCAWAWADIQRDVVTVMAGGNFPWIEKDGVAITCCTDGLRPVVFKIERI